MEEQKQYPISEIFVAPQGEGRWVGRLMTFVRLAGCTVGKPFKSTEEKEEHSAFEIYQTKCTIWDGRTMACDTDYRKKEMLTAEQIEARIQELGGVETVCISGGEPLMHNLYDLVTYLRYTKGHKMHIETSGTIAFRDAHKTLVEFHHVAISPKVNFISEYASISHEIKVLVDADFDWDKMPNSVKHNSWKVYLQPVNFAHTINMENVKRCLAVQTQHPEVLLSTQAHKIWEVR